MVEHAVLTCNVRMDFISKFLVSTKGFSLRMSDFKNAGMKHLSLEA